MYRLFLITYEKSPVLSHPLWHSRELNSEQENLKYGVEEEIARNICTSFVDLREFRALPQVQQLKFFEND